MNRDLLNWSKRQHLTIGALALGCAAMVYAVAASGCVSSDAVIHSECVDAGTTDSGDGGVGGADPDVYYCN